MSKPTETVKVAVRCRPLNNTQKLDNRTSIVQVNPKRGQMMIRNPKIDINEPPKTFTFDYTYGGQTLQQQIYCETAYPIVQCVLKGYNGTIFAYGQTGTGKTHTMQGQQEPHEQRGILPRAFEQIFYGVQDYPDTQFLIRGSFLEIYNQEIYDLLSKNSGHKLDVKEDQNSCFYVKDLTSIVVKGIDQMKEVMIKGVRNRHTGETNMNRESSRSHCIFCITIQTSEIDESGINHYRVGKLNLVDLAGSERQSKTGSAGQRLKEATNINKSLLTLGNVISKLVDGASSHIPYRDSKLTKLLMDSLGGNTKTVMIANIGPADWNYDETISTLRYANRAKNIKNQPHINQDPKDALLRQFQQEIGRLKAALMMQGGGQLSTDQLSMGGQILQSGQTKIIEVEKVIHVEDKEKMKILEQRNLKEKEDLRLQMEQRKIEIQTQVNLAEDEKRQLIEELQKHNSEKQKVKDEESKLIKKLKHMEAKLVQGSQLMEQAVRQEQELQKTHMELEMRRQQEIQLARELERREQENIMLEQKFISQNDEIQDKDKKLKKLFQKYQIAQTEIRDLQHEFQLERQHLVDTIRTLSQELKLKSLVLDNFVPEDEIINIERLAYWNDDAQEFILPRLDLSGNAVRGGKQLKKKRSAKKDAEDYDGIIQQRVQNTVQNILQEYNDDAQVMPIDTQPNVYFVYTEEGAVREQNDPKAQKQKRLKSAKRPGTASRKGKRPSTAVKREEKPKTKPQEVYPEARGLVSRGKQGYRG